MSDNKRRAEFLGIPHGTAFARLKKQILFSLLTLRRKVNLI
jgi:hypothetical protein